MKDRVSVKELHEKANLISLEQCRSKQLLSIMYKLLKDPVNLVIPARNTGMHQKSVFCIDNKIGTKFSNSAYYKGTKLWSTLSRDSQLAETIFIEQNSNSRLLL